MKRTIIFFCFFLETIEYCVRRLSLKFGNGNAESGIPSTDKNGNSYKFFRKKKKKIEIPHFSSSPIKKGKWSADLTEL